VILLSLMVTTLVGLTIFHAYQIDKLRQRVARLEGKP
jgi:hypothetical protein